MKVSKKPIAHGYKVQNPSMNGRRCIWRASKTVNGVKIYARDYGIRAFPIFID
ncbi:MAG: hypothetical protein O3A66_01575 [Proteobacteria bacterium]|nr:hypothetical protein [Pseudomonadota bacterium]